LAVAILGFRSMVPASGLLSPDFRSSLLPLHNMTKFSDLGLSDDVLRAVTDKGYEIPSPIQAKAIPAVLARKDMIAAAQTGTGKTAGFTLPMVDILNDTESRRHARDRSIRALVLTPTRELAAQVNESIKTYSKYLDLKSMVVFGGVKIGPQMRELKRGVDILVATPGRLLDLCNQGACHLDQVEILVLDEADRMLDMGFIHDIRKVIKMLPKKRQNLLFSATFSKDIRNMTKELLVNPVTIEVAPENTTAERVEQRAYRCDSDAKTGITVKLIKEGKWEQVLIFTRTKHGANRLSKNLDQAGIQSSAIHGNKTQGARTKALEGFKNGNIRVLVATDIAARGLDIAQLPHVINFELPNIPEDYIHRIGRTGRAGAEGEAISLVCNDERPFLQGIEKLIKQRISLTTIEGFEPRLWPPRPPTASEVTKAAEARKRANRQAQGRGGNRRPAAKKTAANRSESSSKKQSFDGRGAAGGNSARSRPQRRRPSGGRRG
jgi:ATP-dependent RNA helicase RhlE